jgi:DNA primase
MSDPNATVFIVEGFKACMWMLQAGYKDTVALMGSYISDRQQMMLHRLSTNIVLFLDNDKAGREAAVWVGELLFKPMRGRITVVQYPQEDEDTQPDDYLPDGIHQMVQCRVPFNQYVQRECSRNEVLKQKLDKKRSRRQWQ